MLEKGRFLRSASCPGASMRNATRLCESTSLYGHSTFNKSWTCSDFRSKQHNEFEEFDSFIQRFENVLPSEPMESLRQIMRNVVPRAVWEAAEEEIYRMRSLLQGSDLVSDLTQMQNEISALKMEFESIVRAERPQAADDDAKCTLADGACHPQYVDEDFQVCRSSSTMRSEVYKLIAENHNVIERNRAWEAMHAMLPLHISRSIIEGRSLLPVSKECVSVFFSDIVDFTVISSTMSACDVSDLLHRLISKFDNLALEYGVQKVRQALRCGTVFNCPLAACLTYVEKPICRKNWNKVQMSSTIRRKNALYYYLAYVRNTCSKPAFPNPNLLVSADETCEYGSHAGHGRLGDLCRVQQAPTSL